MADERDPRYITFKLERPPQPGEPEILVAAIFRAIRVQASTDYQPTIPLTESGLRKDMLDHGYVSSRKIREFLNRDPLSKTTAHHRVNTAFESLTEHFEDHHHEGSEHPEKDRCPLRGFIRVDRVESRKGGYWHIVEIPDLSIVADSFIAAVDQGIVAGLPLHRQSQNTLGLSPAYSVITMYVNALRPEAAL